MAAGCVIFDCDGTLVETESLESIVFADMLTREGYPITPKRALREFRGMRKDTAIARVEAELGRRIDGDTLIANWRARTEAIFETQLELVPGARQLIESMPLPFCIASNGPLRKMAVTLRVTGLADAFADRVFSAYDVGAWKPDPGLFLHAARAMGVEPAACIVVEDSLPGVQAGLSAGMTVLAYQPDAAEAPFDNRAHVIRHLDEARRFWS